MAETSIPNPASKAASGAKSLGGKLKGLPPWAYILAVGVGGISIWFALQNSKEKAADEAADVTGDYPAGSFVAGGAGEAYPSGSQGAGYYFDPTTGTTDLERSEQYFGQFSELLQTLLAVGGGGTQAPANPADHYVPPVINVQIPESAVPAPQTQPPAPKPPAAPKPDPCTGEFPFLQDSGPRKGQCYKYVKKNGKGYRFYKNGDKVCVDNC